MERSELASALERLRIAEERLEHAQQLYRFGSWEWEIVGDVITSSDQIHAVYGPGRRGVAASYECFLASVHADDREFVRETVSRACMDCRPFEFEYHESRPDGSLRCLLSRGRVLVDGAGRPERMVGTVQDVTDQRRSEEALRDSEARFRLLADEASDCISQLTPEGVFTYASPAARHVFGWEPEELVGRSVFDFVHPDDLADYTGQRRRLAGAPGGGMVAGRFRRKDGSYAWLESVGKAVRDPRTGMVVGSQGSTRDITERRRAEAALRFSEARLRNALDTSPNAVISIDQQGRVTEWSARAEATFGWSRAEAAGRLLSTLIVPERYREAHVRGLERFRAAGEGAVLGAVIELSALHRDGHEFPVEIAISRPTEGGADGVEFTAFVRDISSRVGAERVRAMQFAVTRTLAEASQLVEAAPRILQTIAEALDWQAALLLLVDPDAQCLRVHQGWMSPALDARLLDPLQSSTWALGEGLVGRVWSTAQPLSLADMTTDPRVRARWAGRDAGFRGAAAFPILHEGRVTGVVTFGSLEPGQVDGQVMAVLADIGSQIGQFVERKRVEAALTDTATRLAALAATDPLTGLPNRREFERALAAAQPGRFALLAIDVDDLKALKDTYGHEAGDAALRAIGTALRVGSRDGDLVARIGGDEFASLLAGANAEEAEAVADRLRRAMHGIILAHGQARISIGCATGMAGEDARRCWVLADQALYLAKAGGGDRLGMSTGATGSTRRAPDYSDRRAYSSR